MLKLSDFFSLSKVFWSENGHLVSVTTVDSLYVLKYSSEAVVKSTDTTDDGIEDAFEVSGP